LPEESVDRDENGRTWPLAAVEREDRDDVHEKTRGLDRLHGKVSQGSRISRTYRQQPLPPLEWTVVGLQASNSQSSSQGRLLNNVLTARSSSQRGNDTMLTREQRVLLGNAKRKATRMNNCLIAAQNRGDTAPY